MTVTAQSHRLKLREMIEGYQLTQAIAAAARLDIADLLASGPRTSEELARLTGAHPTSLLRLLRALASKGIFVEESEALFGLTPLAALLLSDEEGSLKSSAIQAGQPYMWAAWGQFMHSAMTGEPAFRTAHEIGVWDYRERYPETGASFDSAMHESAWHVAASLANAYDTENVHAVVDVGGGTGALLVALLRANQNLRGILYDQRQVVTRAEALFKGTDVADRCSIRSGDFFDAVPEGGDLYVLKGIIHDWDDPSAVRILENCRRAMSAVGRLLLIEQLLSPEGIADPFKLFMDLHMLTIHGARERTEDDYVQLLASAGFHLTRIYPTETGLFLIEATPVDQADYERTKA